jgi:hypothetical protein
MSNTLGLSEEIASVCTSHDDFVTAETLSRKQHLYKIKLSYQTTDKNHGYRTTWLATLVDSVADGIFLSLEGPAYYSRFLGGLAFLLLLGGLTRRRPTLCREERILLQVKKQTV